MARTHGDNDNACRSSPLFMSPDLPAAVNRESSEEQEVNLGDASRLKSPPFRPPHEIIQSQSRDHATVSPLALTPDAESPRKEDAGQEGAAKPAIESASNNGNKDLGTMAQSQQEPETNSSDHEEPRRGTVLKLQTNLNFANKPPRVAGKRKQEEPSPSIYAQQKQAKRVRRTFDTQPQLSASIGGSNAKGGPGDGKTSANASPSPQRLFTPNPNPKPFAPFAFGAPVCRMQSERAASAARKSSEKPTSAAAMQSEKPALAPSLNPDSTSLRSQARQTNSPLPSPTKKDPRKSIAKQTNTVSPSKPDGAKSKASEESLPTNGIHARPNAIPQNYRWSSPEDGENIIVASPKTIMACRAARQADRQAEKKKQTAAPRPTKAPEMREESPFDVHESIETSVNQLNAAIARSTARRSVDLQQDKGGQTAVPAPAPFSPAPVLNLSSPPKAQPPRSIAAPGHRPNTRRMQLATSTSAHHTGMSVLGQAFTHLDNVAHALRTFEHQACEREEKLAEMLDEARDIRRQVVEWRANGLLVIRDRKRKLRHLESLGEEGMQAVDGWFETLRPLTLGDPLVPEGEFQRMLLDNQKGKNAVDAREDGYESDRCEAAQVAIAEGRVETK